MAASRFETNESLGLEVRSQIGGALGPRLINTNRAQMVAGAGLGGHNERGLDVEPTTNVEAYFQFWTSFYIYDRPKTNFDVSLQYYPSLSDTGRQRVQLGAAAKRELWKDLFVALNLSNSNLGKPSA